MDSGPVDRDAIRAELAATRAAFHDLVGTLSPDDWRRPTRNPAWSVGDLLHHLVASLELLPREVSLARQGKGMYNLPRFVLDPLSAWITRWEARRQSLDSVAQRYDEAYAAAMRILGEVRDDEWGHGARFWGEGFKDIEALFRSQARHFAEHGGDIAAALAPDAPVHAPTGLPLQHGRSETPLPRASRD
jgi:uncharacterized protein (TIGR03083 family)